MKYSGFTRFKLFLTAVAAVIAMAVLCFSYLVYVRSPGHGLPYYDSFSAQKADEWEALGGTWAITHGVMQNDSDERGAKLLTGSPYWKDYVVTGEVKLLGRDGDAGLIVRSSSEEQGVDSYSGYYVGLRTRDNRLVLGRANHDWKEAQSMPLPGGAQPFQWYHLEVILRGCQIVASAALLQDPSTTTAVTFTDKDCVRSGRIGLRSYSSGGAWRNIHVRPSTAADISDALARVPANTRQRPEPSDMPFFGSGSRPSLSNTRLPTPASAIQAVGRLRLASPGSKATIRGVVILTSPELFVQDSTGGVAVSGGSLSEAKIGDEVQVTGQVESQYYSTHLRNATMGVLWPHTPVPPISIAAGQAASGAFDSMFVELQGSLRKKTRDSTNTIVLDLESEQQPFQAIVSVGRRDLLFRKMEPNSILRLRGVSVVDPEYTHHHFPFVVLLRSADDLEVLSGPPWWNRRHIIILSICVFVLTLLGHFIHNRVERWRWRTILEEREHLAHEIHDTLAQSFAGLGFQLEGIRDRVPEDIPAVHQQLDLACDLVRRSHQEARRSIAALRRDSGGHTDLLPALELCARKLVDHCGVQVNSAQSGDPRPLPPTVSYALFRIGQEALANCVRHAQPTEISIAVDYTTNAVELTVADNGIGFVRGQESAGFGLQGIEKRAHSIAGTAQVTSAARSGTRVHVRVPLPPRITWSRWPKHVWQTYWRYRQYAQTRKQVHSSPYRG